MNPYLAFVLAVLVLDALLDTVVGLLNVRCAAPRVPPEFADVYDTERYRRSQDYLRVRTRFGLSVGLVSTGLLVAFILAGGFGLADRWARLAGFGSIGTGLVFAGGLALAASLLGIPAGIWRTFVIEERFGFNKTTPRTFALDLLKSYLLAAVLGAPLLALVLWLFEAAGPWAWLLCWAAVVAFELVVVLLAPVLIMPLFVKLSPLAEGELAEAISAYAKQQGFAMRGIFTMDGSRRTTKANALFTGFGRFRRIVLFDTLVDRHPTAEILGVLAHEMGHYKHKHVLVGLLVSIATTGLMLYLLSLFIGNRDLLEAFSVSQPSIYASLVLFGFLYAPLSTLLGIAGNWLSRRHERAADAYAARTTGKPEALASALKRLSADSLGNLTPHPWHVFLNHSHPPVLERIRALARAESEMALR
ncbi:MAG: M48 family metallopeptidase [Deltaproteobacteria bacterium]|nr:M48 family metallopeptidase [Deltaproteobacteria bacterium]